MKDLIIVRRGELYTTSLIISEVFERPHADVLKSIRRVMEAGVIGEGEFSLGSYADKNGQKRPMYELTELAALTTMPFVGGKKAIEGQAKLAKAFIEVREQLRRIERNKQSIDWVAVRKQTKEVFRFVNITLQETRALLGKETESYHYANEARLMNQALTGKYAPVDRDLLSVEQLKMLDKIQEMNSRMLMQGKSWDERKRALLEEFILKLTEPMN